MHRTHHKSGTRICGCMGYGGQRKKACADHIVSASMPSKQSSKWKVTRTNIAPDAVYPPWRSLSYPVICG